MKSAANNEEEEALGCTFDRTSKVGELLSSLKRLCQYSVGFFWQFLSNMKIKKIVLLDLESVWLSKKQVYEKGLASIFFWSSFVLGDYRKMHQEPGHQIEESICCV